MESSEYILNEFGIEIANEKIIKEMSKIIEDKNNSKFKERMEELISDREEVLKGNIEVIKKYVGDVKIG